MITFMRERAMDHAGQATRRILDSMVADGHTPGVQYAFVTTSQAHFFHHAGWADPNTMTPVTERTTFNAYSVTKTLTAVAILQLAEQGLIELDAPLARYLVRWPQTGAATVRQTLLHIAGFANPNPLSWVHLGHEAAAFDRTRFIDDLLRAHGAPVRRPGARYAYSNIGYVLLGELIAHVSGQPYARYVQRHLLAPLGLSDNEILSFDIRDWQTQARGTLKRFGWLNLVLGFMVDRKRLVEVNPGRWLTIRNHLVNGDAYGGLIGNARGLSRYLMALSSSNALVSDDGRARLFETVHAVGPNRSLGWFTGTLQSEPWCAHAGAGAGYYCEARIYPQLGGASAVMFNRAGVRDECTLDRIDHHLVSSMR